MRDFWEQKIEEHQEMLAHDLNGLRSYAKEADEAFARIRQIERQLKPNGYHSVLKHFSGPLDEIFAIANSFERK